MKSAKHPATFPVRIRSAVSPGSRWAAPWFTLVELIVVVTILAVLATVGFLALSGYSRDAKEASARANVRSVYTAISSESALTGNTPRYYVVHDDVAALSWALAFVDGNPVALKGGDWDQAGTNYSAGNPDWAKLKLSPDKFRISLRSLPDPVSDALAAYDPKSVTVGAVDAAAAPTVSGRNRSAPLFQVAGISPATGAVSVAGNFPAPTAAQSASGGVAGLVRDPASASLTGAVVDGASSNSSGWWDPTYPGCDTPDVVLANGQRWAACNVGATAAYAGQAYPAAAAPTAAQKAYLGAFFQWGRNEDVTNLGTTVTLAAAGASSSTVVGSFVTNWMAPQDWISIQNGNLWGGASTSLGAGTFTGQTVANRALLRGPCAAGYHVPTQAEWWSAISTLNWSLGNGVILQADTAVRTALKLPLAGYRHHSDGAYSAQGTNGYYWASSPTGVVSYVVLISSTKISPAKYADRASGYAVRCLAD